MALLCKWNEAQKIAYGKRLLTGSAKSFVKYAKCTKSWPKFKSALKEEFDETLDAHRIHQELAERKKKNNETYQHYIYCMLEIAAQGEVDTQSIIKYIIQGISDDAINKTVLDGAKNIRQLKKKFVQYEAQKREARSRKHSERKDDRYKRANTKDVRKKVTRNYEPKNVKNVDIKTKIVLKHDVPVAARPRRLSPHEKEEVEGIMKTGCQRGLLDHPILSMPVQSS